jgi:hypothetical protein
LFGNLSGFRITLVFNEEMTEFAVMCDRLLSLAANSPGLAFEELRDCRVIEQVQLPDTHSSLKKQGVL